jgi:purine-binding chemotaxis protein CheW
MGRMADARKRARRRRGGEPESPPEAKPSERAPARPLEPETAAAAELALPAELEPQDPEELVFPADPTPAPSGGRISLPASGLASDILAQHELMEAESDAAQPSAEPASGTGAASAQNLSFFGTSARDEKEVLAEATEHLATFYLEREEYGLPVRLVQEIIRVTEITPVPRAPDFIKGVINLRGRIIPVVDLRRKLKLGDVVVGRESRIVVVKLDERLIGLLVDGASQVLRVPVSSIEAAPEEVVEIDEQFIRGVAKLEKRLIILIDLQQVLARELRAVESQGMRA